MKVKVTVTLFNKVLTEEYDLDKVNIEDRELDTFIIDKENNNVLAIYPKDKVTQELIPTEE